MTDIVERARDCAKEFRENACDTDRWDMNKIADDYDALRKEVEELRGVLEGFARHGTRCDTNPTRISVKSQEAIDTEAWWQAYFLSADEAVRRTARAAIAALGVGIEG